MPEKYFFEDCMFSYVWTNIPMGTYLSVPIYISHVYALHSEHPRSSPNISKEKGCHIARLGKAPAKRLSEKMDHWFWLAALSVCKPLLWFFLSWLAIAEASSCFPWLYERLFVEQRMSFSFHWHQFIQYYDITMMCIFPQLHEQQPNSVGWYAL